jgi:peroxiredoxin
MPALKAGQWLHLSALAKFSIPHPGWRQGGEPVWCPARQSELRRHPMTIAKGDSLPDATFRVFDDEGIRTLSTKDVFGGKKVVLFAVPGAFTPTCHLKHMPGFVENATAFKEKGIDTVACVAVNDPFVLDVWAKAAGAAGKVLLLSDGNGEFTKEMGMDFDGSGIGLGTRSKRYAMVVDDGVVKVLHTEESPGVAEVSTAEAILKEI